MMLIKPDEAVNGPAARSAGVSVGRVHEVTARPGEVGRGLRRASHRALPALHLHRRFPSSARTPAAPSRAAIIELQADLLD